MPNDFHVELAGTDLDRLAPYDSALAAGPHPAAPGARRRAGLRLPGAGHDRLRERRGPHAPAGSGSAAGRRRGSPATATRPGSAGRGRSSRSTAPGTRCSRPAWSSAAAPRPTCGSTTPASAGGTSSSWCHRPARAGRLEIEVGDLGSTNGMLVDGHRHPAHGGPRRQPGQIGNTTMTVRVDRRGRRRGEASMSELTLFLIRVAYLAILWIFVLSAISVIRSDMFGARVPEGARQAAAARRNRRPPKPPPRPGAAAPTHVLVIDGDNVGERAELDRRPDPDRPRHATRRSGSTTTTSPPGTPGSPRPATSGSSRTSARPTAPTSAPSGSPSRPRSRSAPRSASARRSSS